MRIAKPLTATRIHAVKPSSKTHALCDGGGLYLITAPKAGARARQTWQYRYRAPTTGKSTCFTLGAWPAMGIAAARQARDEAARLVASGLDPAAERKRAREGSGGQTFEQAARAWDAARAGIVDDRTRATAMARLERHVFRELGGALLTSIQASDLRRLLDRIVANGTSETAHRVCTIIGQVFDWAEARGELDKNPQRLIRRAYPSAPSRHHAAIVDPAGFGALLRAIDGYQGRGITRAALQLLALCFVRSRELRGATWDEVDFASSTWTIPASRMKIRGNGHHVVPLAQQAIAVLHELHRVTGPREGQKSTARHVFPGLRTGKVLSENTLNAALTTLGFGPEVHRAHGFRSSASTMLNDMAAREGGRRFNFEHIEAQLAHRSGNAVRDAYQRSTFLEQRRLMMQAWADECDRLRTPDCSRDAA